MVALQHRVAGERDERDEGGHGDPDEARAALEKRLAPSDLELALPGS